MYIIYSLFFTLLLYVLILTAVAVLFVADVIRQLKSGLYSKSIVYTAKPTLGVLKKGL